MNEGRVSAAFAAAELLSQNYRAVHDFRNAADSANLAASLAERDNDSVSAWQMRLLEAENLLDAGSFEECGNIAAELLESSGIDASDASRGRVSLLLAKARQGGGFLDQATSAARVAEDLTSVDDDIDVHVRARQALIAALAESGDLTEAWSECVRLDAVIANDDVDEELVGKSYWVIGNVAFLSENVDAGLANHNKAAALFSPSQNLHIWAKFNNASAAMRLAAGVADLDTLRCIERAELANDVLGESPEDRLLLKINRSHWHLLSGEPTVGIHEIGDVTGSAWDASQQIQGEGFLVLGRCRIAVGDIAGGSHDLQRAAELFDSIGASQRAVQALAYLPGAEGIL